MRALDFMSIAIETWTLFGSLGALVFVVVQSALMFRQGQVMQEQTKVMETQSQLIRDQVMLMDKQNVLANSSNEIAARQGEIANSQHNLAVEQKRQSDLLFTSDLQNISIRGVRVVKRSDVAEIWVEIANFSNHTACLTRGNVCVLKNLRVVTRESSQDDLILNENNPQDVLSKGSYVFVAKAPWEKFVLAGSHGEYSSFVEVDLKVRCVDGSTLLVSSTWVLGAWEQDGTIAGNLFKSERRRVLVEVPSVNVHNLIRFCDSVFQQRGILRAKAKLPEDIEVSEEQFQEIFLACMSADPHGNAPDDPKWIPWWDFEKAAELLRTKLGL